MKQVPHIDKVMTPMPHTIGKEISLKQAMSMMREHNFRHLPVQEGGKLVGIITDRDVKLVMSMKGATDQLTVEDAMTPDPYCVSPQTPLDRVTDEMAEHKYGCVIVQQENGKVVGIFTATDALRYLGEKLKEHYKQSA